MQKNENTKKIKNIKIRLVSAVEICYDSQREVEASGFRFQDYDVSRKACPMSPEHDLYIPEV
jgi:hypothetical protein